MLADSTVQGRVMRYLHVPNTLRTITPSWQRAHAGLQRCSVVSTTTFELEVSEDHARTPLAHHLYEPVTSSHEQDLPFALSASSMEVALDYNGSYGVLGAAETERCSSSSLTVLDSRSGAEYTVSNRRKW
jgi:hypothetical protein